MSKIIKPEEQSLFNRVKKFEKQPFDLGAITEPVEPHSRSHGDGLLNGENPDTKLQSRQTDYHYAYSEAHTRAEALIREAHNRVEQIRQKAYEDGFAQGLEEARKRADEQAQAASQMLRSLVAEIKARETELLRMLTPRLANLATELAGKIIHKEIDKDSLIVLSQAQEAISKILEREKLVVRVNPADADVMKSHKTALMEMFDGIDKIEVIADPKIERGGCVVETNLVRVDAQPGAQLAAAAKTLVAETEK
ncbi:MAG: hypothetical protein Kow0099_05700 [Candidatus Abyssubacteria bacterium]